MSPTLVMTSAWWLEATPQTSWQLVAHVHAWPTWWHSIREVRTMDGRADDALRSRHWRALSGRRLRLRVCQRAAEPWQQVEWRVGGDICATLIWVVSSAPPGGCDVTCRWEVRLPPRGSGWLRSLTCMLLERSHFARMRTCARDMGTALGCRSAPLREWSGLTRR